MSDTLNMTRLMTGRDGQLYITGANRRQIFLAEVDSFQAQISFSNADFQPVGNHYHGHILGAERLLQIFRVSGICKTLVVHGPLVYRGRD